MGNFIAGEGVRNHKTWVSVYKNGLPKIVGQKFKHRLEKLRVDLENGQKPEPIVRALISVLSMFRALSPPRHIPNFGTITDPFQGQNRTLDMYIIKEGLESMGALSFFSKRKLRKPQFF